MCSDGTELLVAETGRMGLETAFSKNPDMIILDIGLPDIDGLEVYKELQSDPKTAAIPVIALSAYATRDELDRINNAGFAGYLSKPISVSAFNNQVETILSDFNRT